MFQFQLNSARKSEQRTQKKIPPTPRSILFEKPKTMFSFESTRIDSLASNYIIQWNGIRVCVCVHMEAVANRLSTITAERTWEHVQKFFISNSCGFLTRFEDIEEEATTTTAKMNKTRFRSWLSILCSRIFIVIAPVEIRFRS